MFYQVVGMPQFYPPFSNPPRTQPQPLLLIARALQQSLSQYQLCQNNTANDTTTIPPPLLEANTTPLIPASNPTKLKVQQDSSPLRKTSEETIPSPPPSFSVRPTQPPKNRASQLGQVDKTLELAEIPTYGMGRQERHRKLQSLMSRKVTEFKMERGKRCARSSYA